MKIGIAEHLVESSILSSHSIQEGIVCDNSPPLINSTSAYSTTTSMLRKIEASTDCALRMMFFSYRLTPVVARGIRILHSNTR